jgi:septum formation protein
MKLMRGKGLPVMNRLILASQSPRRMALLRTCGIDYVAMSADIVEEPRLGEHPIPTAIRLAREKAEAVRDGEAGPLKWILAADTIVADGDEILGKPADANQAYAYLTRLRGRSHQVITGVCLYQPGRPDPVTDFAATRVTMRDYAEDEIEAYIACGDPFDKAGGYAIQHPHFRPAASVEGCFTNVVGLPICRVHALLTNAGWGDLFPLPGGCGDQTDCGFRTTEEKMEGRGRSA